MGKLKQEEKSMMTVREAQEKVLSVGPQGCMNRLKEFCQDIEQLSRAMQTLLEQDSAVLLVFGVSVKVEVKSEVLGLLFASELGSKVGDKID